MLKTPLVVMMALGLAACSSEGVTGETGAPVDPVERTSATSEELHGSGCPSWGCGENSPILGPYGMEELSWDGAPNHDGVKLIKFVQGTPAKDYDVEVKVDRLIAHERANPANTLSGTALVGGYFLVSYPPKAGLTPTAQVTIKSISDNLTFWLGPATTVETYELVYAGADVPITRPVPLCKHPPPLFKPFTTLAMVEGHLTPNAYQSILYTGDRYDVKYKKVTADSYATAGHWFNIACAGAALLKLHLNRHTTASAVSGWTTTIDQRQTMLKMYTGDFCGSGEAYTQQGTQIHWTTKSGWESSPGNQTSYESLWNKEGAACLTTHRLHNVPGALKDYQALIQGGGDAGAGDCPKPACSTIPGFPDAGAGGNYIMTQSIATP